MPKLCESSLVINLNTKIQKPIDLNLLQFFCVSTFLLFQMKFHVCVMLYYVMLCYDDDDNDDGDDSS